MPLPVPLPVPLPGRIARGRLCVLERRQVGELVRVGVFEQLLLERPFLGARRLVLLALRPARHRRSADLKNKNDYCSLPS